MSNKPIFVATHPRACSTAFERVFMTRTDALKCFHEPFGDAFYYGPERLSSRYENDTKAREDCGFSQSTYQTILESFDRETSSEVRSTPSSTAPLVTAPGSPLPCLLSDHRVSEALVSPTGCSNCIDLAFCFLHTTLAMGKRPFIKDMIYYLAPPDGKPPSIAPSLQRKKRGVGTSEASVNGTTNGTTTAPYPYHTDAELNNPTVVPQDVLGKFHFTFLIRHPRSSIPSFYRCTIPPLDKVTGFYDFMPNEAGYDELRRVFDYLRSTGQVGPKIAGQTENGGHTSSNGVTQGVEVCVVDADDLLDNPSGIIEAYCKSVGLDYHPGMLKWDTEEDHQQARDAFEKWPGFHEDVMHSGELRPREHKKKAKSTQDEDKEWVEKYGKKGAKIIRETVDANVKDYEYLKQFAIKA
ncbi:MAG: hypothetical protein L6R39_004736 [Caloplaca ligustica]|nr:MAG: hypothetical protein L6R39_004736 [Caloplaca ligustica]